MAKEFDLTQNVLAYLAIQLFSKPCKCAVRFVHCCVNVNDAWSVALKMAWSQIGQTINHNSLST